MSTLPRKLMMDRLFANMAGYCQRLEKSAAECGADIAADPAQILTRDLALRPPSDIAPGGSCRLLEARDNWIALNLAREDDRTAMAAWLECDVDGDDWEGIARIVKSMSADHLRERAAMLHLPMSVVGEASGRPPVWRHKSAGRQYDAFDTIRVLDMSSLWAGPLCASFFAAAGAAVTKLESIDRPDRTEEATPQHAERLNGQKTLRREKLSPPLIADLLAETDILVTSARPLALARLGMEPADIFAQHPELLWISITAHGWGGGGAMRVGFGDDCAAAGGLLHWSGGRPEFLGDALADPLTGLLAAQYAFKAVAAGNAGMLDCAMAQCAAYFADTAGNG